MGSTWRLLLFLVFLLPCATLNLPQPITQPYSTLSSRYLISDCGDRTSQVSRAIDLAREAVTNAIVPSQMGTSSGNIYTAFFKRNSASKSLTSMLENIKNQTPIRGRWPNFLKASGPEFVCVKFDTSLRYKHLKFDPYMFCKELSMYGAWFPRSRYIFLCDYFFERSLSPPSIEPQSSRPANTCLKVDRRFNSFIGFGNIVCLYQKYMLIHEMVHFYLGSKSLLLTTKPTEQYDLTRCVGFSEELSLRNPQNYQAFVAMVEQRCVEAPNPFLDFVISEEVKEWTKNSTLLNDGMRSPE